MPSAEVSGEVADVGFYAFGLFYRVVAVVLSLSFVHLSAGLPTSSLRYKRKPLLSLPHLTLNMSKFRASVPRALSRVFVINLSAPLFVFFFLIVAYFLLR